jgi:hypothetical protein
VDGRIVVDIATADAEMAWATAIERRMTRRAVAADVAVTIDRETTA